jgi:effector-binding domain-containing protein
MKVLRIILILLGLLGLLIAGIGFFGPTGIDISHTKEINAPISQVYGHAQDFNLWQNWSPWKEEDPNMAVEYGEITSGQGASYSWSSEKSGVGRMEINEAIPNEKLGMDIGFDMGSGMEYSTCDMEFKEMGEMTEVTWHFNSSGSESFVERLFNVIMPSKLKGQYEKGLNNLEREAKANPIKIEKAKKPLEMGVTEENLEGFYYVGKRYNDVNTTEQYEEMKTMFSDGFGQIMGYLGQSGNGDKMIMPPFSFTHSYDRETTISSFSPSIKVSESVEAGDGLQSDYMKAHKAMVYTHVGSFDNLSDVYEMMVKTLMGKGYTMEFPSYEIYLTDPSTEPDQSKWQTKIVIPVEWME